MEYVGEHTFVFGIFGDLDLNGKFHLFSWVKSSTDSGEISLYTLRDSLYMGVLGPLVVGIVFYSPSFDHSGSWLSDDCVVVVEFCMSSCDNLRMI